MAVAEPPTATDDDDDSAEVIVIEDKAPELVQPVTYELTPDVVRKLPGSSNDALKSLQSMPGMGRVPYGLGGLLLRGTSPRDSNVYLDGIQVPILYHFSSITSFFPSALLQSMKLQPGGYSAEYGRGQGGIVELASRAPRSDRWRLASELSLTEAALQADGPAGDWGSWSFALRRSYVDAVLPFLDLKADLSAGPRYYDGQMRFDTKPWRNGLLSVLMFASNDRVAYVYGVGQHEMFDFDTLFARLSVRLVQRWRKTELRVVPWVGIDRYRLESTEQRMHSDNDPAGLRVSASTDIDRGYWRVGVDATSGEFAVSSNTDGVYFGDTGSYVNAAVWADARRDLFGGRLAIKPGLRVERYSASETTAIDPRVVVSQRASKRVVLTQSLGLYHQPPSHADSVWGNDHLGPSYSVQTSANVAVQLDAHASVTLGGFYSELYNLAVDDPDAPEIGIEALGTNDLEGIPSSREFIARQFGTASILANLGRGQVYGAELLLKYMGPRGFAWLSLMYSRSFRRIALGPEHPWLLDQPYVVTLVGSRALGRNWRIGARVRVASGNPFTPVHGEFSTAEGWTPVYGPRNSERLPEFFQVDVRVDREWKRSWGTVSVFLDVNNVTDRTNIEGRVYSYNYNDHRDVPGLGLIPSFGVTYTP